MFRSFKIYDRYHGCEIQATVVVDTCIDDHDMFFVEMVMDEKGNELVISNELKEQLSLVFIQEYEEEYERMLRNAEL